MLGLGSSLIYDSFIDSNGGDVYTNTHSAEVDGINQALGGLAANSLLTRALATTTDEATIAFWVKIPSTATDNYIYGKGIDSSNYLELKLGAGASGQVILSGLVGGAFSVYTTYVNPFTVGQWHHVALVFSVGGDTYWDIDLYVDGAIPTISFAFSASNTSIDPGGKFNFGKAPLAAAFSQLEFDEIACWDRLLLPGEIQELAGASGDPHGNLLVNGLTYAKASQLVAWYKLNNDLTDSQGGSDLLANNGVTYSTDIPFT